MIGRKMSWAAGFLVILAVSYPVNGQQTGSTPDGQDKCGGCPCNSPCQVPSPPPPSLSPPPPALPPPSSPPPPPKKSSGPYCPPPPSFPSAGPVLPTPPSQYIYFTGPPGDLYPVDQSFSGAGRSFTVGLLLLIGGMLLAVWCN